jgi:hypothetical protein
MESRIRNDLQSLAEGCEMPDDLRLSAFLSEKRELSFGVAGYVNDKFETAVGVTFAEALASFQLTCPTGAKLAKQKREQAKQLLREANEIESQS